MKVAALVLSDANNPANVLGDNLSYSFERVFQASNVVGSVILTAYGVSQLYECSDLGMFGSGKTIECSDHVWPLKVDQASWILRFHRTLPGYCDVRVG